MVLAAKNSHLPTLQLFVELQYSQQLQAMYIISIVHMHPAEKLCTPNYNFTVAIPVRIEPVGFISLTYPPVHYHSTALGDH